MKYLVSLNNGQTITLQTLELDAAELTRSLNDQKFTFVNFGGAVINKHIITSVVPVPSEETQDNPDIQG